MSSSAPIFDVQERKGLDSRVRRAYLELLLVSVVIECLNCARLGVLLLWLVLVVVRRGGLDLTISTPSWNGAAIDPGTGNE